MEYDAPSAEISLPLVVQVDSRPSCAQPDWWPASGWNTKKQLLRLNAFSFFNVIFAEPDPTKVVGVIIMKAKVK